MTTTYLGDGIWARRTSVENAEIMTPTEIQARYAESIQTQNAVSIVANTWSYGSWIDVSGFDKVGVNVNMTSGTGMTVVLEASFDGTNFFTSLDNVYDGTATVVSKEFMITAPYIRLAIKNKDATNAKTTSAWLYLKA